MRNAVNDCVLFSEAGNTFKEEHMKVKVTRQFKDLQADKMRCVGEVFEATKKRADELFQLALVKKLKEEIETASLPKRHTEVKDAKARLVQDEGMEEDQEADSD